MLETRYPLNDKVVDGGDGGGGNTVIEQEMDGKNYKFNATIDNGEVSLEPTEDYPELKDETLKLKLSKAVTKQFNKVQEISKERNIAQKQNADYEQRLAELNAKLDEQRSLMAQLNGSKTTADKKQHETGKFDHRAELVKAAGVSDYDDFIDLSEAEKEDARFIVNQRFVEYQNKQSQNSITSLFDNKFKQQEELNRMSAKLSGTGHTIAEAQAWITAQGLPINESSLRFFLLENKRDNKPDPIKRTDRIVSLFDSIPEEVTSKGEINVTIKEKDNPIEAQRKAILSHL